MFMQSGLTVKWQRESDYYFQLEAERKHRRVVKDVRKKINLKHLQMAFAGLVVGLFLSVVVFCVEKWRKKK